MITLSVLYKLGLALLLGTLIGWEREKEDKPAGVRTCIIVTFSATLAMILAFKLQALGNTDLARIPAYCLVGINFLCSGVIIVNKTKLEGITTSALLLFLVVIGLLCGVGEYILASFSTLIIYFTLKIKYIKIKYIDTKRRRKNGCQTL